MRRLRRGCSLRDFLLEMGCLDSDSGVVVDTGQGRGGVVKSLFPGAGRQQSLAVRYTDQTKR